MLMLPSGVPEYCMGSDWYRHPDEAFNGIMNCLPLITICELHVHCVTAEEGLGVQRELDVGRVRDGVTDQNQV